jgi:hypothetical protein
MQRRRRDLHKEFEQLRRFAEYKRGAEWFSPTPELLARIEQVAMKPEALQLPRYFSSAAENGVEFFSNRDVSRTRKRQTI